MQLRRDAFAFVLLRFDETAREAFLQHSLTLQAADAQVIYPDPQADGAQDCNAAEPRGLPEQGGYCDCDGCARLTPHVIVVAREHLELVAARRNFRVIRRAPHACVDPILFEWYQAITKPHPF